MTSAICALVGPRPVNLAGSGVVVMRGQDILFQRRSDNGLWGGPAVFPSWASRWKAKPAGN